jgi:peptidoglycan hydrolase-like protein with peptidoglycan-binding domain
MGPAIAPRFSGVSQFEQCLGGARMTVDGFDSNGDLVIDQPNDSEAVAAIQDALSDLGYSIPVTGLYDQATADLVRQFKVDQMLPVPVGLGAHDGVTGPGTSGRLNALFTPPPISMPPPTSVPPPPALQDWAPLISFRAPGPMQVALNSRFGIFGRPARVLHALEDARGPINLDYYPVRVAAMPTGGGATMTAPQLLEFIRRNINSFVDGSPNGCNFSPADALIDTPAWLPPFLDTGFPGAVVSIDMFSSGVNVDDGSVVLADIGMDHWIFSTLWTPDDGSHPVSGNRMFGFVPSSAGEFIFYTRGADRTTSIVDETLSATVFGAAHRLWLSFQRRVAAFVNGNGGMAAAETPLSNRYDWPTVEAVYHRPTIAWIA